MFIYNMLLNYLNFPARLERLSSPPSADEEITVWKDSLLPKVSQSVSHSEKTLTPTFLLQILFALLLTTFLSAFYSSWYPSFFPAFSLAFFCRSLPQHRREVVDQTVSQSGDLAAYSYTRYHPMGEVSKDTESLVVATVYFRMGKTWFAVTLHRLERLHTWGWDLPVLQVQEFEENHLLITTTKAINPVTWN